MEEGQIVRLTKAIDGAMLKEGDTGFIVSVGTPAEARRLDIAKDVLERLWSYGQDAPIAHVMILDEHGFIKRAGIVPTSALEEESGEECSHAKRKYDKRLLVQEQNQARAHESMCKSIGAELEIEPDLVDAVINAWDRREREQVSKLRV